MNSITDTLQVVATAVDPVHHGAGTAGNTAILRTQEIVTPDGLLTVVPFISGNSLRHKIRTGIARHALKVMDTKPQSLSKDVVDLLFSGGALTKSGANQDLDTPRRVAQLFPGLTLMGYSAGSSMVSGKLRVDNVHLVCSENVWRMPESCLTLPQTQKLAGSFRSEEFGTRHDVANTQDGLKYTSWLDVVDSTTQMIYDFQVIKAGAVFYTAFHFDGVNEHELDAFYAGLQEMSDGDVITLGAKAGVGFGRVKMQGIQYERDLSAYESNLKENAEEISELLEKLVS